MRSRGCRCDFPGELGKNAVADVAKDFCRCAVGRADHDRFARIAPSADLLDERHLTDENGAEGIGGFLSAAFAEEGMLLAGRIEEVAHVLGDAKEGDVDLLEHETAFACDVGGGGLRSGDEHCAVER